ncbi:MAG: TolC family outer membrane protein [Gammaproteobacteria bacterium]|nr:TolC family outer membrane protein [Gammaproteobacteria bacterium]
MKKLLVVALLSIGLSVSAEDLQQIYELAVENDTQFAQAKIQRKIAGEQARQSLASLLPTVNMSLSGGNRSTSKFRRTYPSELLIAPSGRFLGANPETNEVWTVNEAREEFPSGYSVSLSQVLFSIPTFISYRNSRLSFQGAKESFASQEQNLIIRVVRAYFDVLQARDSLDNALARRESNERQLQQTKQRYDVGLTAITDVLNAQASFDNLEVGLNQSRNRLDTTFLTLERITGQPIQQLSRLSENYPIENPNPNDEEFWVNYALQNNPGVLSAERNYRMARWNHWNTLLNYFSVPSVSLSMNYSYRESPINDPFTGLDTGYDLISESLGRSYGFNIGFSVAGGRRISQNRVSALSREQSRLNVINQRLTIEEQVRALFRNVVQTVLQIDALERSLESNRASLDATEKGYEVGTRNIIEVLNAQNALFSAELNLRNTVHTYITQMLQLKQTVGLLNPNDLSELNKYMDHENVVTPVNTMSGK